MNDKDLLAEQFEANRGHLRSVALRMLGSAHEADDAVQETWLRLCRVDSDRVENLAGWLTTVVARVCLDMLRSRPKRETVPDGSSESAAGGSPEDEAVLADSVGSAMSVVLDTLPPPERVAFVLHDMFAVPFEEIAPIVGRSAVATRQLASRARRRVQSDPAAREVSRPQEREVVAAFLAAAREGNFAALLRLLDPSVVLRADAVAVEMARARVSAGAPEISAELRGPAAVAGVFGGGARAARLALVDGSAGAVVSVGGRPMVVFAFTVRGGRVVAIELVADPETLAVVEVEPVRS